MILCEHHGALNIWGWGHEHRLAPGNCFAVPLIRQADGAVLGYVEVSVAPQVNWDGVTIRYQLCGGGQPVSLYVPIDWTPVHFGGRRPWFGCPRCGRRVGLLYFAGGGFGCRKCLRLDYECQTEWGEWRGSARAEKILRQLGADPAGARALEIPEKPPRMRWRTYERLLAVVYGAQEKRWGAFAERASKLVEQGT